MEDNVNLEDTKDLMSRRIEGLERQVGEKDEALAGMVSKVADMCQELDQVKVERDDARKLLEDRRDIMGQLKK
ncbi:hypothetical protein RUND412_011603, partial [Rhizina undulata]